MSYLNNIIIVLRVAFSDKQQINDSPVGYTGDHDQSS